MRRVCRAAVERGVVIGAQVSYRDLAGFGRRRIDIAPAELRDDVLYDLSGAAGRSSLVIANRLVGNPDVAAALEMTLDGLAISFRQRRW